MVLDCGQLWPYVFYVISFLLPWLQFVVLFCFPMRIKYKQKTDSFSLEWVCFLEKVITEKYFVIPSRFRNFSDVSDLPCVAVEAPEERVLWLFSVHNCCLLSSSEHCWPHVSGNSWIQEGPGAARAPPTSSWPGPWQDRKLPGWLLRQVQPRPCLLWFCSCMDSEFMKSCALGLLTFWNNDGIWAWLFIYNWYGQTFIFRKCFKCIIRCYCKASYWEKKIFGCLQQWDHWYSAVGRQGRLTLNKIAIKIKLHYDITNKGASRSSNGNIQAKPKPEDDLAPLKVGWQSPYGIQSSSL